MQSLSYGLHRIDSSTPLLRNCVTGVAFLAAEAEPEVGSGCGPGGCCQWARSPFPLHSVNMLQAQTCGAGRSAF